MSNGNTYGHQHNTVKCFRSRNAKNLEVHMTYKHGDHRLGYRIRGLTDPSGNMNIEMVDILEYYGKEIPIDFLARELSRAPSEIQKDVKRLEEKGIVKVHNDNISINRGISLKSMHSTM